MTDDGDLPSSFDLLIWGALHPRVLNAQIHPSVREFFHLDRERLVARYCYTHPTQNAGALPDVNPVNWRSKVSSRNARPAASRKGPPGRSRIVPPIWRLADDTVVRLWVRV